VSKQREAATILRSAEPGLLRLATVLSGSAEEARDLVQETFVRAWRARGRLERVEHPAAYLRTILIREAMKDGRRKQRRVLSMIMDSSAVADPADGVANADWALELLRTLPPGQRTVLVLRYYCDLPEAEVAAILQCSVGNVKSQASRAMQSIRTAAQATVTE
jgi:RNA polymerase sigma-70 factor (sigma-E family)